MLNRHRWTATVNGAALPLTEARLGMDADWSEFIQATVTIAGATPELRALTDPRTGARCTMTLAAWGYLETPPAPFVFDLGIREQSADYFADTITLELASDEALAADWRRPPGFPEPPTLAGDDDLRPADLVAAWIPHAIGGVVDVSYVPFMTGAALTVEAATMPVGVSLWDFLTGLLQAHGARLYCTPERVWKLAPTAGRWPGAEGGEISETMLTAAALSTSRAGESWADAVTVEYSWNDWETGEARTATDSTPYAGTKRLVIEQNSPYPGPGAAAMILHTLQTRGLEATASTGQINYVPRPGGSTRFEFPDGTAVAGLLKSVAWTYPEPSETLTGYDLRDLVPYALTWEALQPGDTWAGDPAGIPWTTA